MSFSGGGKTSSQTTNEQNPITATDSAIIANEGSTIQVTDGGAFNLVSNVTDKALNANNSIANSAIDANSDLASQSMTSGLNYFEKAINSINDLVTKSYNSMSSTTQAVFDSAKSDELNQSQDTKDAIVKLGTLVTLGVSAVFVVKYVMKR